MGQAFSLLQLQTSAVLWRVSWGWQCPLGELLDAQTCLPVGISRAIHPGGSCPKTTTCSEMCLQGILAGLNRMGWDVSTGLEYFSVDVSASLLELSVQCCLRDLHLYLDHWGLFQMRGLLFLSSPSLCGERDFLSTQRFVLQVLIIHHSLLQMNHKVNLMKQSTQK